LDAFKDVIHSCPKCSTQIAIYNRFQFFNPTKESSAAEAGEEERDVIVSEQPMAEKQ